MRRDVVDEATLETLYTDYLLLAWAACALHALDHCTI